MLLKFKNSLKARIGNRNILTFSQITDNPKKSAIYFLKNGLNTNFCQKPQTKKTLIRSIFNYKNSAKKFNHIEKFKTPFFAIKNFCHFETAKNFQKIEKEAKILMNLKGQRQIAIWLAFCSVMVFAMVVLGGVTRLTRSGLSMTKWKFFGSMFPRNEEMWEEEFKCYKEYPEYNKVAKKIDLKEFKRIYLTEYAHRMFGRLIGVVFTAPMLYFAARGFLTRQIFKRFFGLFLLGGSQGLIGWWMVKSGLNETPSTHLDLPRVSPYRLSIHLISAILIYTLLLKNALIIYDNHLLKTGQTASFIKPPFALKKTAMATFLTVLLTAFSGAFVAGNEAGFVYNEFPWMGGFGKIVPSDFIDSSIKPLWKNFFENQSAVQFDHRFLATITFSACLTLLFLTLKCPTASPFLRKISILVFSTALSQASLGILTLLNEVPLPLAAMHQSGALLLISTVLAFSHLLSKRRFLLFKSVVKIKFKK